jgi:molybdenum cofactor synthesis domain-containing protein
MSEKPRNLLEIVSVNISEKKGTIKLPVDSIRLTFEGVVNDAHSGPWNRQVSLLGKESIKKFEKTAGRMVRPGEFAENITTSGIELWNTRPLDRFWSENTELEITQIGKECHGTSCTIFKETGDCVMPKEGVFARVLRPGKLKAGDVLEYIPKVYTVHIITLSDRASRGIYEDLSGPRILEMMTLFFEGTGLECSIGSTLLPDDPSQLEPLLLKLKSGKTDIIFTTGGTGIGPKDYTPDVVRKLIDKEIPGIMELIRIKYGQEKPNALLSRSIAGILGQSLIYTLPGSVKAVTEYIGEISKTLVHSVYMLHSIDRHG